MAAPAYVTASTGTTDTTGPWTHTSAAPGAAGRILIVQVVQDGTLVAANTPTITSVTNAEDLAGTDNVLTYIGSFPIGSPTAAWQHLWMGRSLSTSAMVITGNNGADDIYIRVYEFQNVNVGTAITNVIENGTRPALIEVATSDSQTNLGGAGATERQAQSFTGIAGISRIDLAMSKNGSPSDGLVVEIQTDSAGAPSGTVVASDSIAASALTASEAVYSFFNTNVVLTATATYWIVVKRSGSLDAANDYRVYRMTGDPYPRGLRSTYSGVWTNTALQDLRFVVYGLVGNGVGTGTTVSDTAVTTLGVDRLALNFVGLNDDVAIDAFAGETGGDWAEAVAEYLEASGTDAVLQLQISETFMAEQRTVGSNQILGGSSGTTYIAQSFQPTATGSASFVDIWLGTNVGAPTDGLTASIRADASGSPSSTDLGSATLASGSLTASARNRFSFSTPVSLTGGVTYWVVLTRTTAWDAGNLRQWARASSDVYASNGRKQSGDGSTWSDTTSPTFDLAFAVGGAATINGGSDTIVTAGWGVVGFALIGTTPAGPTTHFGSVVLPLAATITTSGTPVTPPTDDYGLEVWADSPRAWYRMKESSGLIQDSSGNANHATGSGGSPVYSQASPISSDASDRAINVVSGSYFTAPHNATLDLGNVFTLEAWIKLNTLTGASIRTILGKGAGNFEWVLDGGSGTTLRLAVSNVAYLNIASYAFSDLNWHHIAVAKNGGQLDMWIDGALVATNSGTGVIVNTTALLEIGKTTADMQMDEVAVYPTALSAARVQAHYLAALGGPGSSLALTATIATGGTVTRKGAVVLPLASAITTIGKVTRKGAVVLPLSTSIVTSGNRTVRGSVVMPLAASITTSGSRTRKGAVVLPLATSITTTPKVTAKGAVVLPLASSITTSGRTGGKGAVVLPLSVSITTAGTSALAVRGAVVLPLAVGVTTSGKVAKFATVVLPLSVSIRTGSVTEVATKTFRLRRADGGATLRGGYTLRGTDAVVVETGAVVLSLATTITTSGRAIRKGQVVLPLAVQVVTSGRRTTRSAVVLSLSLSAVTAGRRTTRGAVVLPLTTSVVTSGTRRRFGSVVLPLNTSLTTSGTRTVRGSASVALNAAITTSGRVTRKGASISSFALGITTVGKRTARGAVVLPLAVSVVTAGRTTRKGAIVLPLALAVTTSAKVTAKGAVVLPLSTSVGVTGRVHAYGKVVLPLTLSAVTNVVGADGRIILSLSLSVATKGKVTARGQSVSSLSLGVTTKGIRTVRGQVVLPLTLTRVTAGAKTTRGQVVLPLALGVTTQGRLTARSSVVLPLALGIVTARGKLTARGQVVLPLALAVTTVGRVRAFAKVVLPLNASFVTVVLGADGRIVLPLNLTVGTKGYASHFGKTATPLSLGAVSAGKRTARGSIVLPVALAVTTVGTRRTFGRVILPLTLDPRTVAFGVGGKAVLPLALGIGTQGRVAARGQIILPLSVALTSTGRRARRGVVSLPLALDAVTVGRLGARGQVILPLGVAVKIIGTLGAYGEVVLGLWLDVDTEALPTMPAPPARFPRSVVLERVLSVEPVRRNLRVKVD